MNIIKRSLARLEMVYSVCQIRIGGKTHFLAATEARGKCLLFSPPDWAASVVWDGPGGCVQQVPIPGRKRAFLAIQGFFPVFQSQEAGIVYAEAGDDLREPWQVNRVLDLPFVHRLEVVTVGSRPYIVAATLCGGKDFRDDWSKPGAVYAGPVPEDPLSKWSVQPILQGVSKNHGMHLTKMDGRAVLLVTGEEGVFSLSVPAGEGEQWSSERLIDREVSDIYTADVDGDGVLEMVAIEPFHGDRLVIYKRSGGSWKAISTSPMSFGHVVWAGEILGRPSVLGGNRRGARALSLLSPKEDGGTDVQVLDEGVGPTQVAVSKDKDCDLIFSANHGIGEVALYEVRSCESTPLT